MYNNPGTNTLNGGALATIIIGSLIFSVVAIIFSAIVYWRIFSKAGYSGAMGLLMFIPIANIIVLCILAFGEWPIYRELNYLRQQVVLGDQYSPFRQEFPPQKFPPPQFPSSPQPPLYDQPQRPQRPQT
jgi:hypothetical protein